MSLVNVCEGLSEHWLGWVVANSWQLALLVSVVAVAARVLRHAPARLRHGLWLLVLVKVFLPPGLTTPWSVGSWGVRPLVEASGIPTSSTEPSLLASNAFTAAATSSSDASQQLFTAPQAKAIANQPISTRTLLMFAWGAGVLCFWAAVGWRYARVVQLIRAADALDEGPAQAALAQIAIDLRLRQTPELIVTREATSPFLFGAFRPKIVLAETLFDQLNATEFRAVLTHELVHYQRRDTWIGWLQVIACSLFWFHPLVWWANRQLRHERECVCDETVLRLGRVTPEQYSECIFQTIVASRGRSLVAGSLVGVFERGAKLQNRLEDVMNFKPAGRKRTWSTRLVLAAFAMLFLPMAPGAVNALIAADDAKTGATAPAEVAKPLVDQTFDIRDVTPQVIKTIPARGATEVDPATTEISITFDRDMGQGMSWTGGPPLFPTLDPGKKARWIDARTCVLPVKLEKGAYYRVGVNSSSHRNFRGADGASAMPLAICFATQGAAKEVADRVRAPKIVKLSQEIDAKDVDPATTALTVTFDVPMGDGMSWTGAGPSFPTSPNGAKATWSADHRVCTLPVKLEAGHAYQLGINGPMHNNFQSEWGVPVEPAFFKFKTRIAKQ